MIALQLASFLLGALSLVCLFCTPNGVGSMILAALFLLCFAAFGWSVGAFTSDSRKAKP